MSVYVDQPIHPYGRMMMCHLVADTPEELHAMADQIGIQRKWFQNHNRLPHYDICKSKRALAVANGAIELKTMREAGHLFRKLMAASAAPPVRAEEG